MGIWETFTGWLTGRPGLYEDRNKVDAAKENLNNIKSTSIADGREAVASAIDGLNAINGFQQYVGVVDKACFDPLFDIADEAITSLITLIDGKVADIEAYNNSSFGEKILATGAMLGSKFGEGILSVGEDILDAGATLIAGWGSKAIDAVFKTNLNEGVSDFIETDWSHKAFEWYYDSDLAKASAITEDSGAAMLAEGAGTATGYLALGGFTVGALGAANATGKAAKVVNAAKTFLGTTTKANTTIAAVGGYGGGVERGLQSGQDFTEANLTGVTQAAMQGGLAYGTAKLGQVVQKQSAIKKAQDTWSKASNSLDDAQKAYSEASEKLASAQARASTAQEKVNLANSGKKAGMKKASSAMKKELKNANKSLQKAEEAFKNADKELINAKTAKANAPDNLKNVVNSKLSSYEGYNDVITNAAKNKGNQVVTEGLGSVIKNDSKAVFDASKNAVKNAGTKVIDAAKSPVTTVKNIANSGKEIVDKAIIKPINNTAVSLQMNGVKDTLSMAGTNLAGKASKTFSTIGKVTGTTGATSSLSGVAAATAKVVGGTGANYAIADAEETAYQQFEGEKIGKDIATEAKENHSLSTDSPVNSNGADVKIPDGKDPIVTLPEGKELAGGTSATDSSPSTGTEASPTSTSANTTGSTNYSNTGNASIYTPTSSGTTQFRVQTPVAGNETSQSGSLVVEGSPVEPNTPSTPSIETPSTEVPNTSSPTPNPPSIESPSTGNDSGNGMSGDIDISEEPVPETPSTTPPINQVEDNFTNIGDSITGNSGGNTSTGSNYGTSIIGGFNNSSNPTGPDGTLSYEDKPITEILDDNNLNDFGSVDKDNSLDVISIDKDTPKNPSTSTGGSAVIPTILGVGAAGAAGVAGIHYVQKKSEKDDEYYEDDTSEYNNDNQDAYDYQSDTPLNINESQENIMQEVPKYKAGSVNKLKLDDGEDIKINENNDIIAPQKEELE